MPKYTVTFTNVQYERVEPERTFRDVGTKPEEPYGVVTMNHHLVGIYEARSAVDAVLLAVSQLVGSLGRIVPAREREMLGAHMFAERCHPDRNVSPGSQVRFELPFVEVKSQYDGGG